MTLTILMSTGQLLCRMSLNWVYMVFFSCLNWGYWFTEGRSQSNIPISLHHIQDTHHQHGCRWWHWPWSPGHGNSCQVFTLSSFAFLLLYTPPPHCTLWKKVTKCSPYSRGVQSRSSFLTGCIYIKYSEFFCMGHLPTFPIYLFSFLYQLFESVGIESWIFTCFILW